MAENIIYYGPPGTGKTYILQSIMNNYVDYGIADSDITGSYIIESTDWIPIAMVLLQNQGKMTTADIQKKIDSLYLGVSLDAAVILEKHSIEESLASINYREQPRIFFPTNPGEWYVDLARIISHRADFLDRFIKKKNIKKRYEFVTFHQSYAYEDFVEGIRPEYVPASNSIDYSPKDGVFKLLCERAINHPEKNYALFIDEINRGNISEIFGELISLIELDKRLGEAGALEVKLPYSKTSLSIPRNISIYGTMNTTDRSLAQIDNALRRRFKFIAMTPSTEVVEKELRLQGIDSHNIGGVDLIKLINTLNARIELLLDAEHLIGHAFFMKCKNIEDISNVICHSVIPLLEEYFYDDLQKIQIIFSDLDEDGNLRDTAIYKHSILRGSDFFPYTGDYLIEDRKKFTAPKSIDKNSLLQIYS